MKAQSFIWHYANGIICKFPSYREAARELGVSEHTIRYYQKKNIHSESDKQSSGGKK